MRGNALTAAINRRYRFVLNIGESYRLEYEPSELKWSELKNLVNKNVSAFESDVHDYWNADILNPWTELQDAINLLTESAESLQGSEDNSVEDQLDQLMQSTFNILDWSVENQRDCKVYSFSIYSVTVADRRFAEINAFMKWASKRCLEKRDRCDAQYATRHFVACEKEPSILYESLASSTAYLKLAALWALKRELSAEGDLSEFAEDLLTSSKAQVDETAHRLAEADRDFRDTFSALASDMQTFQADIEAWKQEKHDEIGKLENRYREELALEEPKQVWEDRAENHSRRAVCWAFASVVVAGLTLVAGSFAIQWLFTANLPKTPLLSSSFLAIAMITFCIYTIRVFVKIALSNGHLAAAYRQKAAMTYFYLSLMEKEHAVSDEERALILNSLFSSVDTGLVKPSDNKDLETLAAIAFKRA